MSTNLIYSVNGPVIMVRDTQDFSMLEMVYVGAKRLVGEVISVSEERTVIQVYENTTGLSPGETVEPSGSPMSVLLGPGIIGNIFDGIQRPLHDISKQTGAFITQGAFAPPLDTEKTWNVTLLAKEGDVLSGGQKYASIPETQLITHYCMLAPTLSGKIVWAAKDGAYKVSDCIVKLEDKSGRIHELTLFQKWPIKTPRPVFQRLPVRTPLLTGQRVIDTLFPIAKGGAAAVPGGFGAGKTMTQHQLAKWCDADIIVYVGCGERGNEMTQVLEEFSELVDPKSGCKLTDRTVLIANTSNMPVAAREASIYTGITLAEYYRDMGYHVALMADSTSRWAEALREISGRLEEMPAEEGFPAYLPSRLSEFYERAGYMQSLGGEDCSVTVIGAVSPQGADFSEPVTQNTKRFVRSFWALDKALAYARHYPSINWNLSYSEYIDDLSAWFTENVGDGFLSGRQALAAILRKESDLLEIVKLIGEDVLPDDQKLVMEIARVIRVGYLQQNAYHKDDTYVPLSKQLRMIEIILHLNARCTEVVSKNIPLRRLSETGIFDRVSGMKYTIPNNKPDLFRQMLADIDQTVDTVLKGVTL